MSQEFERLAENLPRRRVVIQTIVAAEEPFSFVQLCEMVQTRDPSVSRTTVYRTLRLLRERQLIRMTVLQGGYRVFHLDRPVIFWVCDDCSRIRAFCCDELSETLRPFAKAKGFHAIDITIEVRSPCKQLRQKGFCSQDSPAAKNAHRRAKLKIQK
jgi:Fe2+ or Zn2+ uptake regulation protein